MKMYIETSWRDFGHGWQICQIKTEHSVKFKCQLNHKYVFSISMSSKIFGTHLY